MKHKGLNQLVCAALVNDRFREKLLHNPAQALATGYMDHSFSLTPEERQFVVDIQARQLEDFAAQVYAWISTNGDGTGNNGHGHLGKPLYRSNGRSRTGHKPSTLLRVEPFAELTRVPLAA